MPADTQRPQRGLFLDPIRRVLSQVHAVTTITQDAVHYLDLQLFYILLRLSSSSFTTVDEARNVILTLLPDEIATWALKEADQVLNLADIMKGTAQKRSTLVFFEGLAFPIEFFATNSYFIKEKVDPEVNIFLMAVIEYITADILKLAGNFAENHHRKTIEVGDIRATIRSDPVLQELFFRIRSDLFFEHLSKEVESMGRSLTLILRVVGDFLKPIKEHALIEIFQLCQKMMEFHKNVSKIISDSVGIQGIIQVLEHLVASLPLFQTYAKEFDRIVLEIESWRNHPHIKRTLDEKELSRAVEYHLKEILWQPLNMAIVFHSALTYLLQLAPHDQTFQQLSKEISTFGLELSELAKKHECEIGSDQDWRMPMWRNMECGELQSKIEGWTGKNLSEYEPKLMKEGIVGIIAVKNGLRKDKKSKDRNFWLFDKFLIFAKPADFLLAKKGYFFELRDVVNISTLSIREAVPDIEESKFAFELVKDQNSSLIIVGKSEKDRNEWLAAFHYQISASKLAYALEKVLMQESFQGPELPPSLRLTVEEYRFALPDSPENILFEIIETGGIPLIKGGTVLKLVERLTYDKYVDTNYLLQFLLTYRSFMQPMELLDLLIERFNYPTPPAAQGEELEYFKQTLKRPVQLRVFNVLRNWVDKHYIDFQESKDLLKKFLEFISGVEEMNNALSSLSKIIRKKREEELATKKPNLGPNEVLPEPARIGTGASAGFIDLMELDPLEVARHLTVIEDKFYKAIPPHECLNQKWAKKNKEKEAPNILVMIERFNKVSNWVKTFITFRTEYQSRVAIIEKFIKIAEKCMELNNYNAMTEIISGLNSIPVNRLKNTWAGISKKSLQSFQEMALLMAPEKNYARFRKHLHTRDPPCIPYFGVYLTDLTFIEDGNKDLIPGTDLINFNKRRKIAGVISEIQQYQQLWYKFQEIPELIDYLSDLHVEEDEACYQKSLEIEPRQPSRPIEPQASSGSMSDRSSQLFDAPKTPESSPKPERKSNFPALSYTKTFTSIFKNASSAISRLSDADQKQPKASFSTPNGSGPLDSNIVTNGKDLKDDPRKTFYSSSGKSDDDIQSQPHS